MIKQTVLHVVINYITPIKALYKTEFTFLNFLLEVFKLLWRLNDYSTYVTIIEKLCNYIATLL